MADAVGRGVGEQLVEMACAHRHALGRPLEVELRVDAVQFDLTVKRLGEEVEADRAHQRLGERIVDQPLPVGQHALRGDHRGGRAHAGCQVP